MKDVLATAVLDETPDYSVVGNGLTQSIWRTIRVFWIRRYHV